MFLADFGAEVIKVEPPDGDPARSEPGFAVWNRGKKSVVADPADDGRRRWLAELIAGADVCLVSEAGTLAAYGLTGGGCCGTARAWSSWRRPPTRAARPGTAARESHGLLSAALGVAWRQSSYDGGPVESVARFLLQVHGVVGHGLRGGGAAGARAVRASASWSASPARNAAMEANIGALQHRPGAAGPADRHRARRPAPHLHPVRRQGRQVAGLRRARRQVRAAAARRPRPVLDARRGADGRPGGEPGPARQHPVGERADRPRLPVQGPGRVAGDHDRARHPVRAARRPGRTGWITTRSARSACAPRSTTPSAAGWSCPACR